MTGLPTIGATTNTVYDLDDDGYGVPDESTVACAEPPGFAPFDTDCNDDDRVDISDAVCVVRGLFTGPAPGCHAALDTNGEDGEEVSKASLEDLVAVVRAQRGRRPGPSRAGGKAAGRKPASCAAAAAMLCQAPW